MPHPPAAADPRCALATKRRPAHPRSRACRCCSCCCCTATGGGGGLNVSTDRLRRGYEIPRPERRARDLGQGEQSHRLEKRIVEGALFTTCVSPKK